MSDRVKDQLEVFTGNSNPALAREVTEHLGVNMGEAEVGRFPDGEVMVVIRENVRGGDCFVLQSICTPPNENLMELLLLIDALRRASARRITAVIPYFGYARQDRKVDPRVPISAKVVADLITTAGAHRVLTVDLHAGQIQGFFNIPVDNLFAMPVLINYLRKRVDGKKVAVVSPDAGGVERARAFARRLNADLAIIDKRRRRASEVAEMRLVGEVEGSIALLVDDMIDTAGTMTNGVDALRKQGCNSDIYVMATHGIFAGPAIERMTKANFKEVIVTDSLPIPPEKQFKGLKVLTAAEILAEAIRRNYENKSITSLFD